MCAAVLALPLPAEGATITIQTLNAGKPAVVIVGRFELGDNNEFRSKTSSMSRAVVVLESTGGDADAAFSIGQIIRQRGFATAVTTYCYSACAVAWLGGVKRYMSVRARIGFHGLYDPNSRHESKAGNIVFAVYAAEIGLSHRAVEWMTAKGPDEINLLTKAQADRIGVAVEVYDAGAPAISSRSGRRRPISSP
ncbi:MAG: hypothetical protein J2P54_00060 [Bradyrhizobiaceae bacterium]|nr:hypothetical protein [Bradyrhizobiaceae bacterium]